MADGLGNAGLVGLTQSTQKRENANRELGVLNTMVQQKEQDEVKEQQAALMEQQYYDRIRAEADKLLEGDRRKINEKALAIQSDVKRKIKLFGGSHTKFMANGGMAMIGGYSDQVLNSDELGTYRQNKENLTKILDIKEKNMGHLLTPQDQMSLEAYERDGSGTITYNGLMSEIEMPSAQAFEFGYQMTPLDIYAWGDNKVKVTANWMLENPGKGRPTQAQIMAYIQAKGYGGRGERLLPQTSSKGSGAKGSNDDIKHTFATSLFSAMTPDNEVSINDITTGSFKLNDYLMTITGGKKWNNRGQQMPTFLDGFGAALDEVASAIVPGETNLYEIDNGWTLRGGIQMPVGTEKAFFKTANADNYVIEGNIVKDFDPLSTATGGVYAASGELIDGGQGQNADQFSKGDYQFKGTAYAWEVDVDGKPTLVMDAVKEDGSADPERNNKNYSAEGNNMKARPVVVNMLEKDGLYVYQKVPYNTQYYQNKLGEELGAVNDLADVLIEETQKGYVANELERTEIIKRESEPKLEITTPEYSSLWESELWTQQGRNYNMNPEGNLRNDLRKSFYVALKDMNTDQFDINQNINDNSFSAFMKNIEISDQILRNSQYSDAQILNHISSQLKRNSKTQSELDMNEILITKIANYLEIYKAPVKK